MSVDSGTVDIGTVGSGSVGTGVVGGRVGAGIVGVEVGGKVGRGLCVDAGVVGTAVGVVVRRGVAVGVGFTTGAVVELGLGVDVAAVPPDGPMVRFGAALAAPGADGAGVGANVGSPGNSPMRGFWTTSLLRLNAARVSPTAIDGPSST